MHRRFTHSLALAAILVLAFLPAGGQAQSSDVERQIRDQYQGKTFLLRDFYSGDHLHYDSTGLPDNPIPGDWTTDGFVRLNEMHVSDQRLTIKARRLLVITASGNGFQFRPEDNSKKAKKKGKSDFVLEIDAALGPGASAEEVEALLSKIFLTAQDNFANLIPSYWKPCVPEGLTGKNENCYFASELTAIPGVGPSVESAAASEPTELKPTGTPFAGMTRIGHGVTAPKLIHQQEPSFTDPARKSKYQGTMTLGLTVDKTGTPKNIHILAPLGAGLDAQAVHAVSTWRFDPAQKDGQPVAVEIAVEVDFHLY